MERLQSAEGLKLPGLSVVNVTLPEGFVEPVDDVSVTVAVQDVEFPRTSDEGVQDTDVVVGLTV